MKIKSVEIQAFKAYLDKSDGTFDFTTKHHQTTQEPASFVSLFAPNGFGKTSFFDAVDYAITGKIGRYSRDDRVCKQNKDESKGHNKKGEKQYILRNKYATDEKETQVLVHTTKQKAAYSSDYQKPRNGGVDYSFPTDCKPGTNFFEKSILFQEAIDAFLRETNAEGRYEKFIKLDDELCGIDGQRNSILAVNKDIKKKVDTLQSEIEELNSKIVHFGLSESPIEEANAVITRLNDTSTVVQFLPLQVNHQQQDNDTISNKIEVLRSGVNVAINALEGEKNSVQNQLNSFVTTKGQVNEFNELEIKLRITNNLITQKEKLKRLELDKVGYSRKQLLIKEEVKDIEIFKSELTSYIDCRDLLIEINKKIKNVESDIASNRILNNINDQGLLEQRRQLAAKEEALESWLSKDGTTQALFKNIDSELFIIDRDSKLLEEHKKELSSSKIKIEKYNYLIDIIDKLSISIPLNENDRIYLDCKTADVLEKLHQRYVDYTHKLFINKNYLSDVKSRLVNTELHSQQLNQLIQQANEIIVNTQQFDCPLCQHSYPDFKALQDQIKSNPALTELEQNLTIKLQSLQSEKIRFKDELNNLNQEYMDIIREHIVNIKGDVQAEEQNRNSFEDKSVLLSKEIDNHKKSLEKLKKQAFNKSKPEYQEFIGIQIKDLYKSIELIKQEVAKLEETQVKQLDSLEKLNYRKAHLVGDKKINEGNKLKFNSLLRYFERQQNILDGSLSDANHFLVNENDKLEQSESKNLIALKKVEQDLKTQKDAIDAPQYLIELTIDKLKENLSEIEGSLVELKKQLVPFGNLLRILSISKRPYTESDWNLIEEKASSKILEVSSKIEEQKTILSEAKLLGVLSSKALSYKDPVKLEEQVYKLNAEVNGYTRVSNDLLSDVKNINKFIQDKTDAYFNTVLINQLYQAIDPHPDFKTIKFECKIDTTDNLSENPKLIISALDPETGYEASPNLTFSSAQVNVLALSIFLAQALNVRDDEGIPVDCIFIDDPVQSIDSINTLSLIDLLRAICMRFNKQIIVSTHDENFHELLKKKIPTGVFPSKYLKLASFGKVIDD
ncbi:hypothetical protein CJF25_16345 [Photobacterium phosphoreum]|uniref:AAA family ATPase n=1 Tax=Photobacterium phosphoreum TaxID=659 RepID=UPI001E469A56|nr:hypothetical protein [Photobacterium phosphoreum]MCD9464535.1 hypothetical protein [Photobacterium phosphoreum]